MTDQTESPPKPAKVWPDVVIDCVTVIVLGLLMWTHTIDTTVGVILIAFVIGAKLPSKGGGVATLVWPLVQVLRSGASGRWIA